MAAFEQLFEGDSSDEEEKIKINKTYAAKYQKFKEFQELDKLKQKYGDVNVREDSSSTSESEDEDAEALTPQLEQDFLKTLSMIKGKDPEIYKKETVFYVTGQDKHEENDQEGTEKSKQPFYLKDYERQRLLEKGTKAYLSDSDSDEQSHYIEKKKIDELTYNEEQEELKKSFKVEVDSDSDEEESLLTVREKSSAEKENEEEEYKQWLKKEGGSLGALNRYWNDERLDEGEKFLRDYILKRQYIDTDGARIPTYNEIVGELETDEDDQDEEELEREEEFERKFNFRFEEPDQEFIKRYPRTIAESVRRKDEKRKEQRKERVERKAKEKGQKKEELKRLKTLKRKEIMEKIEKLKEITGNSKIGFLEEDMDDDFDSSKYDQLMGHVFDEEYYDEGDDKKPIFSDEEGNEYSAEDNWDEWAGGEFSEEYNEANGPHCEDPDFIMDADYNPTHKMKGNKVSDGKSRRMSKFAEAINKQKPIFNPDEKTFEEYFDEYYKLDYEDIIGDMPVRFKYRNVLPNDFGLSTEEVLKADDKELNEWCSLKKTIRYYTEEEEKKERQKYKKKARNKKKKCQVFTSLQEDADPQDDEDVNNIKIKNRRNINKMQRQKKKLQELNQMSKPRLKKQMLTSKFSRNMLRKTLLHSRESNSQLKRLHKQFKGSNNEHIKKLSLKRLAAYGLDKRKKR